MLANRDQGKPLDGARWTPGAAAAALEDAVETFRMLPMTRADLPRHPRCAWPDWVRQLWHDTPRELRRARPAPTPEAIARGEAVLACVRRLPEHFRMLALARALPRGARPSWSVLVARTGYAERTLRRHLLEAWLRLADELDREM